MKALLKLRLTQERVKYGLCGATTNLLKRNFENFRPLKQSISGGGYEITHCK
jgi:hypothetical protein